jgi:large subunit ribosomal protein L33
MSKKASKANRKSTQIKLVSTADTGFFYIARRNMTQKKDKMEVKKYDPVARKHVLFKEKKISS